jgi:predicted Zn-dependent peptidase
MVFKGAGSRDARAIVEEIETEGGQINAATGYERTSFQVRALKGGLPLAMAVTADLVRQPTLDPDDLAREKHVVGQEIAEAADTPDDEVFEIAQARAFADQPLGRPILGAPQTIASADPAALEAWRASLYAPDRLVISAAGAVDEDELLALAESGFGATAPPGLSAPPTAVFAGGPALQRRRLEQAHLVFLLPAPGVLDEAHWALRLFAEVLGGGMSSRLFQEARERLGLAYAIDAYAEAYADVGVLGVYAGCAAGDAGRLAEVVASEIAALAGEVRAPELARAGRRPSPDFRSPPDSAGYIHGDRSGDTRRYLPAGQPAPGAPPRGGGHPGPKGRDGRPTSIRGQALHIGPLIEARKRRQNRAHGPARLDRARS